jgi:hypothetical protein
MTGNDVEILSQDLSSDIDETTKRAVSIANLPGAKHYIMTM